MRVAKKIILSALVFTFLCAPAQTLAQRQRAAQTSAAQGLRSRPEIKSRAEFDTLSRINTDAGYPLPHVMYVIDRKDRNKIYYVNSKRYRFHKDFVNGTYLSLERGREFFENNYLKPNRRFILGTLAYQTPLRRWTFEFWEGDLIPAEQIKLTNDTINRTFYERVAFKPNSIRQDEASAAIAGLERVSQSEIAREQEYQPLNLARGLGRIHIIKNLDEHVEIGFNEILVLDEVPVTLPPVAGIITGKPSTPLSHINLLAKSWGVPNAYVRNAAEVFKEYDGWWVSFETKQGKFEIKRADNNALNEYQRRLKERRDIMTPRYNLSELRLLDLRQQRARMADAYGAKSANLGEVVNARLRGITVPNGFTVPIRYYDDFIKANELELPIAEMMDDQKFVHDPAYRRERLTEMRARIQAAAFDAKLRDEILKRVRAEYAGKGLFVRSSTNAEDLPNFNGAGLYSTVPNVREEEKLIEAIKTVWASVWNFEAY
ncbi:MAG TPA: PEP/pyruvate-binding domain-containing protein, partial [Pyrinomonadaceae bacterium]|nr:PEP/pyruvate-binding domain-containing protein [Pyrinomonadaceae bacterium]